MHENQIIISILSNAILPDFAEKQNKKLVDIQTRGGFTKVADEAQEMFILTEQIFSKTAETERHLKKVDINAMTEELLQDTKIISLYKSITGASIQMILIYWINEFTGQYPQTLSSCMFFFLCKRHHIPQKTRTKKVEI